jgi:hypothetical protein
MRVTRHTTREEPIYKASLAAHLSNDEDDSARMSSPRQEAGSLASFERLSRLFSVPAIVRWSRSGVPGHLERSDDAPCFGQAEKG